MKSKLREEEFFPTPAWCTRALLAHERFVGSIWEPACGNGAISKVLAEAGLRVESSDLHNRGFGEAPRDFLKTSHKVHNIITNPPFTLAEAFLRKALDSASLKIALLLRLAFLEGSRRAREVFTPTPPQRVWVFSERITMYPEGKRTAGTGTMAFAWFVWDSASQNKPTELGWLMPGFRDSENLQSDLSLEDLGL